MAGHKAGTVGTAVGGHGGAHAGEGVSFEELVEEDADLGGVFRATAASGALEELAVAFFLAGDGVVHYYGYPGGVAFVGGGSA